MFAMLQRLCITSSASQFTLLQASRRDKGMARQVCAQQYGSWGQVYPKWGQLLFFQGALSGGPPQIFGQLMAPRAGSLLARSGAKAVLLEGQGAGRGWSGGHRGLTSPREVRPAELLGTGSP